MTSPIDSLLMLTDNDIDYQRIPQETLAQLSVESDTYIANSALTEWWTRNIEPATQLNEAAWKILSTVDENDYHLQSTALRIIFEQDRSEALSYMITNMRNVHPYLLNTIIELLMYDSDFRYEALVASMVQQQISGNEEEMGDYLDPDSVTDFNQIMRKQFQYGEVPQR